LIKLPRAAARQVKNQGNLESISVRLKIFLWRCQRDFMICQGAAAVAPQAQMLMGFYDRNLSVYKGGGTLLQPHRELADDAAKNG
jgi:hypothetical protein